MNTQDSLRVWDPVVRIGHWFLVIAFVVAYATGDEEDLVHAYSGYVVLGIVVLRIVWGFVGTRYARFGSFVFGPGATWNYLKSLLAGRPKHYVGHNPLGGYMVLLLLASLVVTTWTGLVAYGKEGYGPLASGLPALISTARAGDDDGRGVEEEVWEEAHEFFADFTLVLVVLHLGGVALSSYLHRENLVKAMITGRKPRHPEEP